jgi:hypothetical protein
MPGSAPQESAVEAAATNVAEQGLLEERAFSQMSPVTLLSYSPTLSASSSDVSSLWADARPYGHSRQASVPDEFVLVEDDIEESHQHH